MAKLKTTGLDLSRPLEPAYPAELIAKCIEVAAQTLHPKLSPEKAINALGHAFFRGYTDTLLGKAMLALMKVIGPMRTLERMQRNFRTGNNSIETRFRDLGPQHAELWFNEVNGMPTYIEGILEEGGDSIGAYHLVVTHRTDPSTPGTWFDVKWQTSR